MVAALELDDGGSDLAEALVRQADDRHVLDRLVVMEKVLHLHRIDVLATADDDVLLAVDQVDEAFFILARHVAGEQPAVFEHSGGGFRIAVVALHDPGSLDGQLADLARGDRVAGLADYLGLPLVAGLADGAHFVDVLHPQMHAARADRFGEAVVGVVLMVGKALQPAVHEAGRHRLRADVHQPPLVQLVVLQLEIAPVDRVEDVLHPGDEQPHDGDLLVGDGPDDPFRFGATQEDALAAGQQAAEPVHLAARVIEGGDAHEVVFTVLPVMRLLHDGGRHDAAMVVQDGLREAGGARREVDGGVVVF